MASKISESNMSLLFKNFITDLRIALYKKLHLEKGDLNKFVENSTILSSLVHNEMAKYFLAKKISSNADFDFLFSILNVEAYLLGLELNPYPIHQLVLHDSSFLKENFSKIIHLINDINCHSSYAGAAEIYKKHLEITKKGYWIPSII